MSGFWDIANRVREASSGAIAAVKAKSEIALEVVRRDLNEFATTVKDDTGEAFERAMEERADSEEEKEPSSPDQECSKSGEPRNSTRMVLLQTTKDTYTRGIGDDELEDFSNWRSGFEFHGEDTQEQVRTMLTGHAVLGIYHEVVPDQLSQATFWERYFFRAHRLSCELDQRRALMEKNTPDEEFALGGWEDEDDEDDKDGGEGISPRAEEDSTAKSKAGAEEVEEVVADAVAYIVAGVGAGTSGAAAAAAAAAVAAAATTPAESAEVIESAHTGYTCNNSTPERCTDTPALHDGMRHDLSENVDIDNIAGPRHVNGATAVDDCSVVQAAQPPPPGHSSQTHGTAPTGKTTRDGTADIFPGDDDVGGKDLTEGPIERDSAVPATSGDQTDASGVPGTVQSRGHRLTSALAPSSQPDPARSPVESPRGDGDSADSIDGRIGAASPGDAGGGLASGATSAAGSSATDVSWDVVSHASSSGTGRGVMVDVLPAEVGQATAVPSSEGETASRADGNAVGGGNDWDDDEKDGGDASRCAERRAAADGDKAEAAEDKNEAWDDWG